MLKEAKISVGVTDVPSTNMSFVHVCCITSTKRICLHVGVYL